MKEFEDLKGLLRNNDSFDMGILAGAFENLSQMNKNYKLSFIVFSSIQSPIKLFHNWHNADYSFNLDDFNGFHIVNLSRTIKKAREIKGSFGVSRFGKTNIWMAFTSESSDFFENGVVRFIESYRPDISRIYLSSEELRELFERVEDNLSCEIYVKKAVLYSHVKEGIMSFENKQFQELFNEAETESRYVDKVEYDIQEDNVSTYHGFVSRNLISYYYSGRINRFLDYILPTIAKIVERKINIFKDKERNYENAEATPLCINFSQDVIGCKYDNIRLIKALEKVSGGAVAVYHKNPYLHMSFLDFIDGSNFDIFITDSNKITIIPNYKCSMYSLMRVTDQIFKGFDEGDVKLAERYTYSFADFMAE
ncbi:MAG: hypothetical protein WC628_10475 [Candidatus Omnitrophota bacterium]